MSPIPNASFPHIFSRLRFDLGVGVLLSPPASDRRNLSSHATFVSPLDSKFGEIGGFKGSFSLCSIMENMKPVKSMFGEVGGLAMSKSGAVNFSRINVISLLAGALAVASVFLPWWGIDASGFGSSVSARWTLWNGPSTDSIFRGSTQAYPTLTSASPIIGALAVISFLLALAGSFTWNIRPLIGSFILSVLTPIAYLGVVSYAVTNSCSGQSNCLSGPFGTETFFGITLNWGFQIGFYLYLFAGALTLVGLGFHRIFHKTTLRRETLQASAGTS